MADCGVELRSGFSKCSILEHKRSYYVSPSYKTFRHHVKKRRGAFGSIQPLMIVSKRELARGRVAS